MNNEFPKAWYKQFWPWFLIALPLSVVIASLITIYISLQHTDPVVVDDYYKAGLAINRNLGRELKATELGLQASINIQQRQIALTVEGPDSAKPAQLTLRLLHPTLDNRDQTVTLSRTTSDTYHGQLASAITGSWHLMIESDQPSWRIQKRYTTH